MFGSQTEDNFEIHWQKPYIIKRRCQKCVHPDLVDLGDTSLPRPCTDVNAAGVQKLQHYKDTYISLCTKNWL